MNPPVVACVRAHNAVNNSLMVRAPQHLPGLRDPSAVSIARCIVARNRWDELFGKVDFDSSYDSAAHVNVTVGTSVPRLTVWTPVVILGV